MNAQRFLELQERDALEGLRSTARRLSADLSELSLVPQAARRHPWLMLASATGLGFASGKLARAVGLSAFGRGARGLARGTGRGGGRFLRAASGLALTAFLRSR